MTHQYTTGVEKGDGEGRVRWLLCWMLLGCTPTVDDAVVVTVASTQTAAPLARDRYLGVTGLAERACTDDTATCTD